jgi:HTH-type transcriptional regulator, competence development regulator
MNELGKLLKELRGKESLRSVGERTGLSHSYISDIENGFRRGTKKPIHPSADTLKRLAKAYNYSPNELLKKAGYIEEESKTPEEIYDDPDFQLAMRSAQGFSEESKEQVLKFIKMMEDVERARNQAKGKNNK